MSFEVRKMEGYGIRVNYSEKFVEPFELDIDTEEIREYGKEHPFPEGKDDLGIPFTEQDMIDALTCNGEGTLVIDCEAQAYWVADMLNAVL